MSKSLADIIAAVQSPGAPTPAASGTDPMTLIVTLMQSQQAAAEARVREEREARQTEEARRREDKAESNKMLLALAGILLPKLFDKPSVDPLLLKMMENNSNKDALKDFLQTSSALQQQSSQMMMQQMAGMMGTMGEFQSNMMERQLTSMEERIARNAEKDDGEEENNPIMDIIKAALPAILGPKAAPVGAAVVDAAGKSAAQPAAPGNVLVAPVAPAPVIPADVMRKIRALQIAMALHLRGSTYDAERTQAFRRNLVKLIVQSNDVARAILSDDQAALFAAFAPAVEAEKPLQTWIMSGPAQAFLGELIATTIKPGLLAVAQELQRRKAESEAQAQAAAQPIADVPATSATLMAQHGGSASVSEPPTLGPDNVGG